MKRIAIVGGNFDRNGGRPSKIIDKIGEGMKLRPEIVLNGGSMEDLVKFIDSSIPLFDAVIWMPNIDNEEVKLVDRLKVLNPHMVLVQSKRRIDKEYSDFELVKRALKSHSQLLIAIDDNDDKWPTPLGFCFSLIDPLGNLWVDKGSLTELIDTLDSRLGFLMSCTRSPSRKWDPTDAISDEFLKVVRSMSDKFDRHITAVNPDRFLGNVSTRCCLGFPSTRHGDRILVSRRNVNKAEISKDDFVEVWDGTSSVLYSGNHKPSVDAAIQLRLFRFYHNINYIFHGHCYVKDAPFTSVVVPCGSMEEVGHIMTVVPDFSTERVCVNLRGHGCLIMSNRLDYIDSVQLESRPFPERHNHEPAISK